MHTGSPHTLYLLAGTIMRLYIKPALPCSVHTGYSHTLYLLAGTNRSHTSLLSAYMLSTYAVPPCWYNYAFIHQSTSLLSVYRLSHTLFFSIIMRLHIKAAFPCSVHTGSSHTLYNYTFTHPCFPCSVFNYVNRLITHIKAALPCSVHTGSSHTLYLLAGTIMRLYIKAALPCSVHTGYSHTLYLLAGTIMRFTSNHFLAQCIQALPIRCTSLLVQLCVLHQSRTNLLSAYRLFTYAVQIEATLLAQCIQLCVCWYIHQSPHFLAQCIQALHIRCTSLLVQLCVLHQSRTSLLSAYRLFTYAVLPC